MTPKSEAQKVERKYPTLFTTVLAAVLARNRDLSSQVASLSAEKVQMQDNAAARDQDLDELREHNRDLSSQVTSLSAGKVRMQEAMAEQDVQMQALEQEKEALMDEKNQNAFANLDQQLAESTGHKQEMDAMLKHSATLVRRTLHAENTLQSERGVHEATEAAYRMVLGENKTKSRKRGREAEEYVDLCSFENHTNNMLAAHVGLARRSSAQSRVASNATGPRSTSSATAPSPVGPASTSERSVSA